MKFGKYLSEKQRPEWQDKYLQYNALKDLIKEASREQEEMGPIANSPRTTSLTFQRAGDIRDSAEDRFFQLLEEEVDKLGQFTASVVDSLRERLFHLQTQVDTAASEEDKNSLLTEAKKIGDEFLALEKYVNLNYMGFHKILKKHDKKLPQSPCSQFYISHLHNQPWVQGNYSDLLLSLSNIYSQLRGDQLPTSSEAGEATDEQPYMYTIAKYWISMGDVSAVKHHILQHLPVFKFSETDYSGDSQLVNSIYLDNASLEIYHGRLENRPNAAIVRLSWYGSQEPTEVMVQRKSFSTNNDGETNLEHSFSLPADAVPEFLEGENVLDKAVSGWRAKGLSEENIKESIELFSEIQKMIDAKQLKPMLRTQYMRTLFQIPFDPTVRIKLDTNISMVKEIPEDGPSYTNSGRWYRDPSLPINRTEIARFPYAVLELDLSLSVGMTTPTWVQELIESGLLRDRSGFSKHQYGTATLFPDMAQVVPYWIDDGGVRASMFASVPEQLPQLAPTARDLEVKRASEKPRKGRNIQSNLEEPLLPQSSSVPQRGTETGNDKETMSLLTWWFSKPEVHPIPRIPGVVENRIEPKTYFANERTFLSWLHMALTMGSISAAMLGFSSTKSSSLETDEVALIAIVLLPVAVVTSGYALLVYHWRSRAITAKTNLFYDDRRGPLALTFIVVLALISIFLISFVDLLSMLRGQRTGTLGFR